MYKFLIFFSDTLIFSKYKKLFYIYNLITKHKNHKEKLQNWLKYIKTSKTSLKILVMHISKFFKKFHYFVNNFDHSFRVKNILKIRFLFYLKIPK